MAIIKCPACGAETSSFSSKCDACGAEFKFCPQCGNAAPGHQAFCTNCGHRFQSGTASPTGNDATSDNNAAPNAPAAQGTLLPKIKGKKFAIGAFVLAIVAFFFVFFAQGWDEGIKEQQELLNEMSSASSEYYYYIENLEDLLIAFKAFCVISIVAAAVSDILVVFAYIGHAQNLKRGITQVKYILVFAIIATVLANLFGIIAIAMLA